MNRITACGRYRTFYTVFVKRALDIICSALTIAVFWWLFAAVAVLVRLKLGSPVIFKQPRPGRIDPKAGQETIFTLYKFRTMTNETDAEGNLLPNEQRLTRFGKLLRSTSLDELPEVFNILFGRMSLIGPRPQLVHDMVFMTDEQRTRHLVRPGLSGLAQVSGRNALEWDVKLDTDLEYLKRLGFAEDARIVFTTVRKVFMHEEESEEIDICEDFGEYLLNSGRIDREYYDERMSLADKLISDFNFRG